MNSKVINLFLVVLLFAAIIGASYLWYKSYPSDEQIKAAQKGIQPVDKTVFQSSTIKTLAGRDKNGQIPVTITKDDIGKADPFVAGQ